MARQRLSFDKTEIVLIDTESKSPTVHNLRSDNLVRLRLVTKRVFALYQFVEDQALEFHSRDKIEPILLRRRRNKKLFDGYLNSTRKFCETNQIPFVDDTQGDDKTLLND